MTASWYCLYHSGLIYLPWRCCLVPLPITVAAPDAIGPVVLIFVEPPIVEFPLIVVVVIVLLVRGFCSIARRYLWSKTDLHPA